MEAFDAGHEVHRSNKSMPLSSRAPSTRCLSLVPQSPCSTSTIRSGLSLLVASSPSRTFLDNRFAALSTHSEYSLWGVTCVQTYTYFQRSSKDQTIFKLLVSCNALQLADLFSSLFPRWGSSGNRHYAHCVACCLNVLFRGLDTFDSFLNCHILYYYFVTNFANPLAIASPVW